MLSSPQRQPVTFYSLYDIFLTAVAHLPGSTDRFGSQRSLSICAAEMMGLICHVCTVSTGQMKASAGWLCRPHHKCDGVRGSPQLW